MKGAHAMPPSRACGIRKTQIHRASVIVSIDGRKTDVDKVYQAVIMFDIYCHTHPALGNTIIMKFRTIFSVLLLGGLSACQTLPIADLAVTDRAVWNGDGFDNRDLFVVDGTITDRAKIGSGTISLGGEGRFIVPGYADAHQHRTGATDDSSDNILRTGTYYLWNPNSLSRFASDETRTFYANPNTIDVANSYGGLTEPGSHPEPLYTDVLAKYVYPQIPVEEFENDAFYYARTEKEAIANVDRLARLGADFIKIYLLESENFEKDGSTNTGIDPELIPSIVDAAHERGLFVVAHLESVADLQTAAAAGVDVAGHLPGYGDVSPSTEADRRIMPELAALIARSGMVVIPTYAIAETVADKVEAERAALTRSVQRDNLRALRDAGVTILSGTDGSNTLSEPRRWVAIDAMTTAESLKAFLDTGSRLFPRRNVGCLDEGCRADFIILADDPSDNLDALEHIVTLVKNGNVLRPPEE